MSVLGDFAVPGGRLFLVSLFDKVTHLRACEFIAERLRHGCFLVGIAEFLGAAFFIEYLVLVNYLYCKSCVFFFSLNSPKVRTIMISVILSLFIFYLYFTTLLCLIVGEGRGSNSKFLGKKALQFI